MAILSTYPRITDSFKQGTHSGLNFAYGVGSVRADNVVTNVAAGTVTLTDNATNYIEITTAGVISANTTSFTSGKIPLYKVVTVSGEITNIVDVRCFLSAGVDLEARELINSLANFVGYTNNILFLYNEGSECGDITGGWEGITTKGTAETIKNTDNLYVHSAAYASDGMFATANLIDLTEYSTIKFEYIGNPTGGWVSFRVGLSKSVNCIAESNTAGIYPALVSMKTTVSFDISALNGSYYVKVGTGSGSSSVPYFNAYKIWLEK